MKTAYKIIFLSALAVMCFSSASAHQPRLTYDWNLPDKSNPAVISNPDVSQAFYGALNNAPHYFQFTLDKPMDFYFGVLVPDLPGIGKDISAELSADSMAGLILNGEKFNWTQFYEEFAGDNYFKGPELKTALQPGTYQIKISNPSNLGKYVLVVGTVESFPLGEAMKALVTIPQLKVGFFEKSVLTSFNNVIGLYLFLLLTTVTTVICAIFQIFKVLKARKLAAQCEECPKNEN